MKSKVLVTGALYEGAIDRLKANEQIELTYLPDCPREELLKIAADQNVIISRSETTVDKELIDHAPELKIIARAAVGVGNIDIEYATEKGILVINTPGKNTNSAAELTMAMLLGMFRNVPQAHMKMKSGGWDRHSFNGSELKGKSIGIVGLGNVGHRVAQFARGFDMTVYAYDPYIAPRIFERNHTIPCQTLDELASKVDILTVHVPLNKETTGMVDEAVLLKMKPGSYVLNIARGGVIDEETIVKLLDSGHLSGAAIDTWLHEPKPLRKLVDHEKVWCSPHIGATTVEAQIAIGETIVEQVEKALSGSVVDYPVNLPQIGIIDNPLLKPYAVLAEKLGSMAAQILDFNPTNIDLFYRGDLAGTDQSLIRLGFVKGYVSQVVDGYISFVNAGDHFKKLGVNLVEKEDPAFTGYRSAIKLVIYGERGEKLKLGGVVFDEKYPRISLIDDFYFEVEPSGCFIVSQNDDKPGVVGEIGRFFGENNINIDSFDLSRNQKGGKAMALVKVDTIPTHEQLVKMSKIKNMISTKCVVF